MTVTALLDGNRTVIAIDTGANRSYISERNVRLWNIPLQQKQIPYELFNFDGKKSGKGIIDQETVPVVLRIGEHWELLTLDVADTRTYPVILGMNWVNAHNPEVNFNVTRKLRFTRCNCSREIEPPARMDSPGDLLEGTED